MFKHVKLKGALALAVPVIAALMLAVSASAGSPQSVTFGSSNDGASAGWSDGKGSPIDLTLGSGAGSFALVRLHHANGLTVRELSAPSFTTDNYGAGSPRYYIALSDGNSLWGYPPQSGLNGTDMAWAINNGNTYMSWSAVQTAEGSASVKDAYVIADADQSPGTMDQIDNLTFGGVTYND
jgi:hypothetical protein